MRSRANQIQAFLAACVACTGLAGAAAGQVVLNPSFEQLNDPGDQFLFTNWVDFTAYLQDPEVVPYDGIFAAKQYGLFYYQFPFGVDGLPAEMQALIPTWDLDGDGVDDCCDTIPANNTVIIQDIGAVPVGSEATLRFRYYQVAADAPDASANFVQGLLNFRDDPWPAPVLGNVMANVDLFSVANDEWVEISSSEIVPDGTNFGEIVLIQFQFPTDYAPIDADGDGVQDVNGSGFPAFTINAWGGGASHWDMVEVEFADACYADFNSDGVVDTRDVIAFLNAWNGQDAASDCDDNGVIDTRDVICFLNSWNAGC